MPGRGEIGSVILRGLPIYKAASPATFLFKISEAQSAQCLTCTKSPTYLKFAKHGAEYTHYCRKLRFYLQLPEAYDAVYDQPYISVPKTSEFKSGPRVVKMVLNTQCYQYLWLTM